MVNNVTLGFRAFLIFAIVLPAGGAQKFPDYPARPAAEYAIHTERNGVTIGIQAIEDIDEQKIYFDVKLTPKGIVPVFVVIENRSSESFLFDQTNVGYGGAFYNFTPNLGLTKIQENISRRQLKSATLSPGQSVHGFLYVPAPRKGDRPKVHLQVPLTKAGTSESFVLNLVF